MCIRDRHGLVADISGSAQEQAVGLGQVNTAVNEMDRVTQQNAGMVHETASAAADLAHEAQNLSQLIGRFRLASPASSAARRAA